MTNTATIPSLVKKSEAEEIPLIGGTITLEEFNSIIPRIKGAKVPLYFIKGYTKGHVEKLFCHAYKIFGEEKFQEALPFFRTMIIFNHLDMRGWIGIAGCYQSLKNYKEAIKYYLLATEVDPQNPMPFFLSYICYMGVQDYPKAMNVLERSILLCGESLQYVNLKEMAEMIYNTLKILI